MVLFYTMAFLDKKGPLFVMKPFHRLRESKKVKISHITYFRSGLASTIILYRPDLNTYFSVLVSYLFELKI